MSGIYPLSHVDEFRGRYGVGGSACGMGFCAEGVGEKNEIRGFLVYEKDGHRVRVGSSRGEIKIAREIHMRVMRIACA